MIVYYFPLKRIFALIVINKYGFTVKKVQSDLKKFIVKQSVKIIHP